MKNFKVASSIALALLIGSACSKSDDSDDTATQSNDDVVLMEKINLECGEDTACFGDAPATLRLSSDDSALQTLRMFAWLSLGFPDEASYLDTLGGDPSDELMDMIPQEGFAGNIENIRADLVAAALEEYPTLASCSDAPTSGSFDMNGGTVTWEKAAMKAPATFPADKAGETYDKAVTYESEDGKRITHFEFFCDYNGMVSVFTANDDDGEQLAKYAFFYDRETSDDLYTDFYLTDHSGMISTGGLELGVQLRSPGEGLMQVWVSRTGVDPDRGIEGYRYAVNANITDEQFSFFVLNEDTGYTQAQWDALAYTGSTATSGGDAYSGGGSGSSVDRLINGCTESWDATTNDLTDANTCDGLDIEEAPAPALDDDGDSSLEWCRANLQDLIDAL